ncbi:hypothetical protein KIPB_012170, partial [Kipferlia bialata]|eukprot:g12170.t1
MKTELQDVDDPEVSHNWSDSIKELKGRVGSLRARLVTAEQHAKSLARHAGLELRPGQNLTDGQKLGAARMLNTDASNRLDGALADLDDIEMIQDTQAATLAADREKMMMISGDLTAMTNDLQ